MLSDDQSAHAAPDPGFWTKTSLIQLCYGMWVNCGMIIVGLAFGFSAVAIPQLRSPGSELKVTTTDESWIVSIPTLVSPIGCVLSGYLIDKFGRRSMLIYSQIPVSLGWLYTGFAQSAKQIIIGRIITGIGMGMVSSVPRVYLTEISLPNMRGVLGAFANVAISVGITIQAGLGSAFDWTTLCYISSAYSSALFLINFGLPETPYYLLSKTSMEKAKAALIRIRSTKYNIDAEMDKLIEFKREHDIRKLSFMEQMGLLFKSYTCKPFWLIAMYLFITQCSGVTVVAMWTVEMLTNSRSSVDAHFGNVILGATRTIGGICTSILLFKVRRRVMAITSGEFFDPLLDIGLLISTPFLALATLIHDFPTSLAMLPDKMSSGVGTVGVILGLFIKNVKEPTVVPLVLYVIFIFFGTFGHYTLPTLMMYELYPLQVRGLLGGISTSTLNVLISAANWCYPFMRDSIGFAYTMICFGVCSFAGCAFLYRFLPETKGLTLQQTEGFYKDRH